MTMQEIQADYEKRINSIFDLMEKIDQRPKEKRLKEILKREQRIIRRVDGLRNKFNKK